VVMLSSAHRERRCQPTGQASLNLGRVQQGPGPIGDRMARRETEAESLCLERQVPCGKRGTRLCSLPCSALVTPISRFYHAVTSGVRAEYPPGASALPAIHTRRGLHLGHRLGEFVASRPASHSSGVRGLQPTSALRRGRAVSVSFWHRGPGEPSLLGFRRARG
jgi:hypothetical protein